MSTTKLTHYREWDTIVVPEFLATPAWGDRSYHNDLCASSVTRVTTGYLRVWVEHVERDKREHPAEPRFYVDFGATEDDLFSEAISLFRTESEEELRTWLEKFIADPDLAKVAKDQLLFQVTEQAKHEVRREVEAGRIPNTVTSFSDLHDYCDANGFGGAFDGVHDAADTDFWNAVQGAVDLWIKAGALKDIEQTLEAEVQLKAWGVIDPKNTDSSEHHAIHEILVGALDEGDDHELCLAILDEFIEHAQEMKKSILNKTKNTYRVTFELDVQADDPENAKQVAILNEKSAKITGVELMVEAGQ